MDYFHPIQSRSRNIESATSWSTASPYDQRIDAGLSTGGLLDLGLNAFCETVEVCELHLGIGKWDSLSLESVVPLRGR